jgi:hypothetical protein
VLLQRQGLELCMSADRPGQSPGCARERRVWGMHDGVSRTENKAMSSPPDRATKHDGFETRRWETVAAGCDDDDDG